ncbi:hypothetical protein TREMEDRAFT_31078 [Tremella mesenterica DSM 1558]|uniref:uncharacterized protein n=1 Tax=Tremella mesenterica (strain ATCC 24925 / CBS 8224 / DSM 1558 / NBRC 9311 / NRRL Y-6157 / RJB 2259-6 / UBC 559-6) TaxID=578456 RepID=UPI0003F4A2A8|nr:uncharacterized protein TREMEDRAFT_31078 [Tremella mesenterica DSM 1558]EIW69228.1 hypothetical protein TREMEDRAFT_31078 [Tremella mesenterica DSM 1558]
MIPQSPSRSSQADRLSFHQHPASQSALEGDILPQEKTKSGPDDNTSSWPVEQPPLETFDENALLNLPPPLPFDLRVENLLVGVPGGRGGLIPPWIGNYLSSLSKKTEKGDRAGEQGGGERGKRKRWILKNVGCSCSSGEMLAILGGSGSGKTTLLNAIAHRLSGLPIEDGTVGYYPSSRSVPAVDTARQLTRNEVKRRIGFVRQQDYLVEHLTVRETLTYAARLRLPTTLSHESVNMIVEQTIDELGLRDAADTVVGGPLRKGISGGEKRRLSIGCVLVTLPSVLILDEPTSGLDAFTSYLLLLTLSQLARRGRTVILSIHAPRSDAFSVFDRIALLSKGEIVYSGLREDCLSWFSSLGHTVDRGVNPLDFLIDISTIDNRDGEKEEITKQRVKFLVDSWKTRDSTWTTIIEKEPLDYRIDNPSVGRIDDSQNINTRTGPGGNSINDDLHRVITGQMDGTVQDVQRPGFSKQTRVLLARAHKNVYRNIPQLIGLLCQAILLGVIMGVTFYQLPDTPTGIQSLKNLTFQFIPGVLYLQQVFWIWKFCNDLIIFDREREDRLYDVIPYVISDWLSFFLPSTLSPAIYSILLYFIAGLRKDDVAGNLFTVVASTVVVQYCVQGLAFLSVCHPVLHPSDKAEERRHYFHVFGIYPVSLESKHRLCELTQRVHVPVYVSWIRWISPYFYSYRILATTQFKDRTFHCPPDSSANLDQCIGNNVLRGLNVSLDINIGAWFGGLIGLALVEYALACLVLWVYPAGGVKHAAEIESHHRGKQTDVIESHMTRDRIDVEVRNLTLNWERRGRGVMKDRKKVILDDVSVRFPAGEISAILGPSGAGKSTLLQLLAGRKLQAGASARFIRTGDMLFANEPASTSSQSNIAFVEQDDDWHLPSLTVRETLRYAAILRLPNKMPKKQKIARAETVLLMLGLKDCADLPVGGALLKGISGGEKRRLSLAVQMINDPAVLLVDEPTSGLDASIALSVMQVLKDIAASGRTVIATIHQPRSDIWRLADNVTLLAKGGIIAFSGKRSSAVDYFTSIGHPMPSEFFNPADHLLDLVSIDPRSTKHEISLSRVSHLTSLWRSRKTETIVEPFSSSTTISRGSGTTSILVALPVVLSRHWKSLWRRKDIFFNRLFQTPLLGAMFILFFQRLTHGPSGAQDRIGITIESTSAIAFVGLLNAMAIFPGERNLYLHESQSSARYSAGTFVVYYTLVEIWMEVLAACGYAAIMNIGVGMQTSARIYFEFATTIFAMTNMGESFAMIFGAWINTEGLTVTVVSTILSIIGQISGVVSLSLPAWLGGLAWAFCTKAATRVQIINECLGLMFNCTNEEIQSGVCIARSGDQLLALFGWKDLSTARYVEIMLAVAVAWRIVAWGSIAFRTRQW